MKRLAVIFLCVFAAILGDTLLEPPPQYAFAIVDWLLVLGFALSAGATTAGIFQQREAADAAADAAEAQAAHDAEVAQNRAQQEENNRASRERAARANARRRRARMESVYARSGVLLDGTPSDWLVADAGLSEWDIQQDNQSSRQKQASLLDQAGMMLAQGDNQANAARMRKRTILFKGLGQLGMQTASFARAGGFGSGSGGEGEGE